jgi:stringent starvation protein B
VNSVAMTSSRPYLVRAMHEWLVDNELTPYLMVDTSAGYCQVPEDYIEDNRIVLNVSPRAVRQLDIANNQVSFDARFSGVVYNIIVPMAAVIAIYASENGRGMVFDSDDDEVDDNPPEDTNTPQPNNSSRPSLRIVK